MAAYTAWNGIGKKLATEPMFTIRPEDCLRHSHNAEEIGFEHGFDLRETQFLDGAGDGNPGVVHQNIDSFGLR